MRRREAMLRIHPGEVLKEEFLVPHRVSASRLAAAVGVPSSRIYGILHGRRDITAELAILLAHAFQTTPEFGWLYRRTMIFKSPKAHCQFAALRRSR